MWLPLTTLFHLGPLWIPHKCMYTPLDPYPTVVLVATTLSFLWHLTGEQVPILTALDYTFAFLWALLDVTYAYTFHDLKTIVQVVYLNLVIATIHRVHESIRIQRQRTAYVYNHSLWHLLSATKCMAVALLLQCH
jgi:hypothetical protein